VRPAIGRQIHTHYDGRRHLGLAALARRAGRRDDDRDGQLARRVPGLFAPPGMSLRRPPSAAIRKFLVARGAPASPKPNAAVFAITIRLTPVPARRREQRVPGGLPVVSGCGCPTIRQATKKAWRARRASSRAAPEIAGPTAEIRPSDTATSASRARWPVPSTRFPPAEQRSVHRGFSCALAARRARDFRICPRRSRATGIGERRPGVSEWRLRGAPVAPS